MVEKKYLPIARENKLEIIFLVSPTTTIERIIKMDAISDSFLYVVSSNVTTGKNNINRETENYFQRIKNMNLKNPLMIGFGISDKNSFDTACNYASGAIIGSAFIKAQDEKRETDFIGDILAAEYEPVFRVKASLTNPGLQSGVDKVRGL